MTITEIVLMVLGVIGCGIIMKYLHLWIFNPIKRDWELSKGGFLSKVALFVVSIPFATTMIIQLIWGDSWHGATHEDIDNLWSAVLFQFLDPSYHTFFKDNTFSAVIAIFGVFFLNGLLISTLTSWFDKREERWQEGEIRYKKRHLGKNRFAVVIGSNEIVSSVIRDLLTPAAPGRINKKCESNNKYVILQTSRDVPDVRNELASHLTEDELERVIIYKALRDSEQELRDLYLEDCTEIYVLGESTLVNGGETYHDAMNMRCVNLIAGILEETREERIKMKARTHISARRVCKVMFEYQTTYSILQFSDVSEEIDRNLVFIPFNRYESWARKVMVDCEASGIKYTPLDGDGISKESDEHVHFVVVGMSKMGVAMGVQAMMQAHYLNYAYAESLDDEAGKRRRRTRITFIDTAADKEMDFFTGRYNALFGLTRHRYIDAALCTEEQLAFDSEYGWIDPMHEEGCRWKHLSSNGENFIDLEIEFIKGELESEHVRRYLECISDRNNPAAGTSKLTMAICLTQTHQAVAAALYMPICLYEKAQEIWVYQREAADILLNLTQTKQADKRYKKLRPFGMLYGEYMYDRKQYLKALLVNGMYNLGDGDELAKRDMSKKETYKDLSDLWKTLTLDKKFSNRYYVDSIPCKLRSLGIGIGELQEKKALFADDCMGRTEHNRWTLQQLLFGYSPCDAESDKEFEKLNTSADKEDKKRFKQLKQSYKEGEHRIHPNICDFNHLDKVDSGAKGYDAKLNSIIPVILHLTDEDKL